MLPQIVYSSLFDAVVLESETESKWLHGADDFRTLVMTAETVDVNDLDDDGISKNNFISYEDLADNFFEAHLDLKTVFLPAGSIKPDGIEKALIDAEKFAAINGEDKTAEIKAAWLAYFDGDLEAAREIADGITAQPRRKMTSSSAMPALLLPKSSSLRTAAEIQLSVLPKQTAKNTRHTSCVTVSTQASDLRSCLMKCRPSVFRRTRTDIQKKSTSANKKLRIVAQLRRSFLLQYTCFVI